MSNHTKFEQLLNLISSSIAHFGVFELDLNGSVLTWNENLERITGYKADETIGRRLSHLNFYSDLQTKLEFAKKSGRFEFEERLTQKNGHNAMAKTVIAPLNQDREHVGYLIFIQNKSHKLDSKEIAQELLISETKTQAEHEFRLLFDLMPQLGWTAKPDGFIDFYNKGWYDYTGTTYEQMQGWGWESVHDPEILPQVTERWNRSISTGKPFEMKFPLKSKDGNFEWFITRINPVHDTNGNLVRWVGINTNIQQELDYQSNLESLIAERTAELQGALEAKSRFLSTVSHEVRTPMSGVIGLVEMLAVTAKDDDAKKLASAALDASKRLLQILNDLLDASRLQAGAVTLERRSFAIRPVMGDLVQLLLGQSRKKNIEVASEVAPEVPDTICGDELRVRQILQNLAFNAVKFTESGFVKLSVELVNKTETAFTLKFLVQDSGIGITAEQQKRLFLPFAQAADATTRLYGGTGLGLHICKTLVDLMGGSIEILESQAGKGTTFSVVITFEDDQCKMD